MQLALNQNNVAFGLSTINPSSSNANNNSAFGSRTLAALTSGDNNTAVGYEALVSNTTGSDNVAVGGEALLSNLVGVENVAVGVQALRRNNTGDSNIAIGYSAMFSNTNGDSNVAAGFAAMQENTTGSDNVAIGDEALLDNVTGNNNIAIGSSALFTITSGSNNVAIGEGADVASNNLTNAIALGQGAIVNNSNSIRLGNTAIESIFSSGTLTLDGVTYPNSTGTVGQVLTVSSTTSNLYFADASNTDSQTLAEVTSQGTITTDNIQVGGMTVSGTIGLTVGESSNHYKFPTRKGTVGQTLVVSSTTGQLEFSSSAFMLARIQGSQRIQEGDIDSLTVKSGTAISGILPHIKSSNIQISTTDNSSDTIILPAGRTFRLTTYIKFQIQGGLDAKVQYKFYDRTSSKWIGLVGLTDMTYSTNEIYVPAISYVTTGSSSLSIAIIPYYLDSSGAPTWVETLGDISRIEIEEIK